MNGGCGPERKRATFCPLEEGEEREVDAQIYTEIGRSSAQGGISSVNSGQENWPNATISDTPVSRLEEETTDGLKKSIEMTTPELNIRMSKIKNLEVVMLANDVPLSLMSYKYEKCEKRREILRTIVVSLEARTYCSFQDYHYSQTLFKGST